MTIWPKGGKKTHAQHNSQAGDASRPNNMPQPRLAPKAWSVWVVRGSKPNLCCCLEPVVDVASAKMHHRQVAIKRLPNRHQVNAEPSPSHLPSFLSRPHSNPAANAYGASSSEDGRLPPPPLGPFHIGPLPALLGRWQCPVRAVVGRSRCMVASNDQTKGVGAIDVTTAAGWHTTGARVVDGKWWSSSACSNGALALKTGRH